MESSNSSKIPRRKFLQYLAAAPVVLGATSQAKGASQSFGSGRRIPMLQTWADENSAWVVVMGPRGLSFQSQGNSTMSINVLQTDALNDVDNQVLYRLELTGLSTANYSQLGIYSGNQLLEVRSVKALDLNMSSPNLAVVSCANYRDLDGQEQIYSRFHEANTDAVFFIGDIVYSNSQLGSVFHTPEDPLSALGRYIETWKNVDFYQLEPLIPVFTMWDDHDYGMNNGDATNPYRDQMKEIYRTFYPMPQSHDRLSYGPGVSFRLQAFGMDLHFLDDRSFQVLDTTIWGNEQEDWFFNQYRSSSNPAWIMNGIQFWQYAPVGESIAKNALPSLQRMRKLFKSNKKPVVLFSGDVHYSQVQSLNKEDLGINTYEITSSAIHSSSVGAWLERTPEDGQIFYYGDPNFLMVRPTLSSTSMSLDVTCATMDGIYRVSDGPLTIKV